MCPANHRSCIYAHYISGLGRTAYLTFFISCSLLLQARFCRSVRPRCLAYKKGSAKYVSYAKDEEKEDETETEIHYHIVYLVPTDCKQDDIPETVKFDPSL